MEGTWTPPRTGSPPTGPSSPPSWSEWRPLPEETGNISFGKRVGEGTSMAVDRLVRVEAYDQLRALLADVTRALDKFDEGSYGICDRCGVAIPPERLEILPWAVLCVRCAEHR